MRVPEWRIDPEPVWIRCVLIRRGDDPGEFVVQFKINGGEFTAFVPEAYVDPDQRLLQGYIVANWGDDWLIDIPTETLTSGPRVRVPENEKESLVLARG